MSYTPAYTQETTSTTGATRTFPWGVCTIADNDNEYGARVSCNNAQEKIGHYIWLRYSSVATGKVRCRAGTTDLTAPQNKICQSETGQASGTPDGGNAIYWDY